MPGQLKRLLVRYYASARPGDKVPVTPYRYGKGVELFFLLKAGNFARAWRFAHNRPHGRVGAVSGVVETRGHCRCKYRGKNACRESLS